MYRPANQGGQVAPALRDMVDVIRRVIKDNPGDLSYITAELDGITRLNRICGILDRAVELGNSSGVTCAKPKASDLKEKGNKDAVKGVAVVRELQVRPSPGDTRAAQTPRVAALAEWFRMGHDACAVRCHPRERGRRRWLRWR